MAVRDHMGRFQPGTPGNPGPNPRNAITNALRRKMDPEAIADFLIEVVHNREAPLRERIAAAREILDRVEGKAVTSSQNVNVSVKAEPTREVDFDSMSEEQLERYLELSNEKRLLEAKAGITSDPVPEENG